MPENINEKGYIMKLIVHRGAHEVGGNCVEISTEHTTILMDVGLPLSFNTRVRELSILCE